MHRDRRSKGYANRLLDGVFLEQLKRVQPAGDPRVGITIFQ
jgi:hypothetical protein